MQSLELASHRVDIPTKHVELYGQFDTAKLFVMPQAEMKRISCTRYDNQMRIEYVLLLNVQVSKPYQVEDGLVQGQIEVSGTMHYMRHQKDSHTSLWIENLNRAGFFDVSAVTRPLTFTPGAIPITQLHTIVTRIEQWHTEMTDIIQTALQQTLQSSQMQYFLQNQSH